MTFQDVLKRYQKQKFMLQVKWAMRKADIFDAGIIKEFMNNDKEHTVIDLRQKSDWAKGHIPGALNIPFGSNSAQFQALDLERDDLIVVYCHCGKCSAIAAWQLKRIGYRVVSSLDGGLPSWVSYGFTLTTIDDKS